MIARMVKSLSQSFNEIVTLQNVQDLEIDAVMIILNTQMNGMVSHILFQCIYYADQL